MPHKEYAKGRDSPLASSYFLPCYQKSFTSGQNLWHFRAHFDLLWSSYIFPLTQAYFSTASDTFPVPSTVTHFSLQLLRNWVWIPQYEFNHLWALWPDLPGSWNSLTQTAGPGVSLIVGGEKGKSIEGARFCFSPIHVSQGHISQTLYS